MIETFFKTHSKYFVNLINRYLDDKSMSEDIVQEAFITAYLKQDQYDPKRGSLKTWFNKIVFNKLWEYKRKIKRQPTMLCIEHFDEEIFTPENFKSDMLLILNRVKNPHHRKILEYYFIYGYSKKQISLAMDIQYENVKKVVHRFMKVIKV